MGPDLSLLDHVLLSHFYHGLRKEAAFHLDLSSGGSFTHMSFSEGEAILQKILENTPYTSIYDEFPKEEKEVEPSPEPKDEEHTTKSKIPSNPSNDLVATEPPTEGTHHTLESDEPLPSMFLSEIEVDLFEDFGNASNLPVQVKPRGPFTLLEDNDGPHNDSFIMEHIKGLSAIMSREWLVETKLSTEVA
jgi:hypothetical protein